jgi:hypothetical protein
VEDELHPLDGPCANGRVGKIALDELDVLNVGEVVSLTRYQTVDHAHAMAAPDQLLRQMGPDEAGAAGDEIGCQRPVEAVQLAGKPARWSPGMILSAFAK